jgi:ketosteroid isomerase-like protein
VLLPRTFAGRLVRAAALLGVAASVVAGCGADTESGGSGGSGVPNDQQVRAVVTQFGTAAAAKDYRTICDQLLADTLVKAVESIGLPCESALQKGLSDVRNPTLEVRQVSIAGSRALVSVHSTATGQPASDDAMQLVKEDGQWKIASLAEPSGGAASSATPPSTATPPTTTTSKKR